MVVELGFCDGVVDVDGRNEKTVVFALVLQHLVQVVDTSCGLLGNAIAVLEHVWVLGVDESGEIASVVEDEVQLLAVLECIELLF